MHSDEIKLSLAEHRRLCSAVGVKPAEVRIEMYDSYAMSPYNSSSGWYNAQEKKIVLLRRHIKANDLIAAVQHETAHHVQSVYRFDGEMLAQLHGRQHAGPHRLKSWYAALILLTPHVFPDVVLHPDIMPWRKSKRVKLGRDDAGKLTYEIVKCEEPVRLTEEEATHWPDSLPVALERIARIRRKERNLKRDRRSTGRSRPL